MTDAEKADRAYIEAKPAADEIHTDEDYTLQAGKKWCTTLENYAVGSNAWAAEYMFESNERDDLAVKYLCPKFKDALALALRGFDDGTYEVMKSPAQEEFSHQIAPATYRTSETHDCYWERTTANGTTIANDFVTFAPKGVTVTVKAGEGFVSKGCGVWLPVK